MISCQKVCANALSGLLFVAVLLYLCRDSLAPMITKIMQHRNTYVEAAFAAKLKRMQQEQWHDKFDPEMHVDCGSEWQCPLDSVFNASKPVYGTIDRVSKLTHERFLKVPQTDWFLPCFLCFDFISPFPCGHVVWQNHTLHFRFHHDVRLRVGVPVPWQARDCHRRGRRLACALLYSAGATSPPALPHLFLCSLRCFHGCQYMRVVFFGGVISIRSVVHAP